MSAETCDWAKKQRCGDPVTKAVLMEIANWGNVAGYIDYLAVRRMAEVIEVSERTVQRHINRLEHDLLMIRRVERRSAIGGQLASGFELIGYEPPLSLAPKLRRTPGDNLSPPRQIDTPPGDAGVTPPVTMVSPQGNDLRNNTLSTNKLVDAPQADFELNLKGEGEAADDRPVGSGGAGADGEATGAKPIKAHALPDGWEPPAVDDLQPEARGLVKQWPSGAYQVMCANFANYWRDTGTKNRKKSDWKATLCNWLIRVHSEVKRAEKAGVSYAVAAPVSAPAKVDPPKPVAAKRREDATSKAIHARLKAEMGDTAYSAWIMNCAIIVDEPGLTVVASSTFIAQWVEQNHGRFVMQAAERAIGKRPAWVRYDTETQHQNSPREGSPNHG